MAFRDPEDLNKDVLQKNSVIFDVKILRENWHARQATNVTELLIWPSELHRFLINPANIFWRFLSKMQL